MRLPKKVKVAGHMYKVLFPYKFKGKLNYLLGQCDINKLALKIADRDRHGSKLTDGMVEQIFIHELTHAINFHYDCGLRRESQTQRFSEGLYQVLKDNPKLLRRIKNA